MNRSLVVLVFVHKVLKANIGLGLSWRQPSGVGPLDGGGSRSL